MEAAARAQHDRAAVDISTRSPRAQGSVVQDAAVRPGVAVGNGVFATASVAASVRSKMRSPSRAGLARCIADQRPRRSGAFGWLAASARASCRTPADPSAASAPNLCGLPICVVHRRSPVRALGYALWTQSRTECGPYGHQPGRSTRATTATERQRTGTTFQPAPQPQNGGREGDHEVYRAAEPLPEGADELGSRGRRSAQNGGAARGRGQVAPRPSRGRRGSAVRCQSRPASARTAMAALSPGRSLMSLIAWPSAGSAVRRGGTVRRWPARGRVRRASRKDRPATPR